MANSPFVIDAHLGNFQEAVIETSRNVPVLVDFWAPWCGPCRALGPTLERLAAAYAGKFLLAKVNSDENPELSTQYGIRGIPAVKAFRDGRVVDEFTGALPESAVRQFIDRLIPPPGDELRREAMTLRNLGRIEEAEVLLRQSLEKNPANDRSRLELARIALETGRYADARTAVEGMSPTFRMEPEVEAVTAMLDFADTAKGAPDEDTLKATIAAAKGDERARAMYQLAVRLILRGDFEDALDQLIAMVERHRPYGDDLARKTVLKVFNLLGNQGPLVETYRTRLSRALY